MQTRLRHAMVLLFLTATPFLLPAQEAPPAAPGPAAQATGTQAQFNELLVKLKAIRAEMDLTVKKYQAANPKEKVELAKLINALHAKGLAMQEQFFAVAEKAYREAPNANQEVIGAMLQTITRDISLDRYDEALKTAQSMIDQKCDDPILYDRAGVAAFNLGKFDLAEKYLNISKEKGVLNQMSQAYLSMIPYYKEAWAKERQLREAEAKADDLPRVLLKTNKGDIEIEMFENEAPYAVANFISLVEKGYYNGLTFHRVLPGFMAQGGCPKGTGTGGPGYHIPCECYRKDFRKHFIGTLSMAHAGRDTGGSQFFLTFLPTKHLDGKHTAFGRVIKGFDVLPKLQRRDPSRPNSPAPDKILEAKVLRKRDHPYKVKTTDDVFNE